MINKEDLDTIINDVTWSYEESGEKVPQNILDTLNEIKQVQVILNEYNVTSEILREVLLTGQMFRNKPTLLECIKEWEEKGYEIISGDNCIVFRHHKTYKAIEINLINLSYKTYEWYDEKRPIGDRLNIDEAQFITLDLHNLIHKTIKALEEMKDD
jgi:hypothetical protein